MGLVFLQDPSWQMHVAGQESVFSSSYKAASPCSAVTAATALPTPLFLHEVPWTLSFFHRQRTQPPTYKNDIIKTTLFFRRQQMFFLLSAAARAQFPAKWKRNKISCFSECLRWPDTRCICSKATALVQRTHEASTLCNGLGSSSNCVCVQTE